MYWGKSGYAGSPPKRTIKTKYGNVTIRGVAYAQVLNSDDPDVSFAYCFCGSLGSQLAADQTMKRGIAKAQFEYIEAVIPDIAKRWAKALSRFPKKIILDIFIGEKDHRGITEPYSGLRFDFDMQEINAGYKKGSLSTGGRLSLDSDLFSWYQSAKERLMRGQELQKELAALHVGLHYDD